MTIGFATTYLTSSHASFLVAADSRYSWSAEWADIGIKTYALGCRTAAVAAGNALSVASTADLVRGVADHHDRNEPNAPINFSSTVRLFSYFLDRTERENASTKGCEVVLAGFLDNGSPALAKVTTLPASRTVVHCCAPKQQGSLIMMVGQQDAKDQIASAIARAFGEGRQHWAERAAGTIWYLCKHEGVPTIGGAPSVAVCERGGNLYWPFVVVDDRTFLRGFDVTESMGGVTGDGVLQLSYDESWHTETDQQRVSAELRHNEGFFWASRYVDEWIDPQELFLWKVDPDDLKPLPDMSLAPSVVPIFRPGELPWLATASD